MSEEKMEMMELENEAMESETEDYGEESGSGKALVVALTAVAGLAAAGVAVAKKVKAKKDDAKPRKKKRLRWVEVEDEPAEEDIVDTEAEEVEDTEEENE